MVPDVSSNRDCCFMGQRAEERLKGEAVVKTARGVRRKGGQEGQAPSQPVCNFFFSFFVFVNIFR